MPDDRDLVALLRAEQTSLGDAIADHVVMIREGISTSLHSLDEDAENLRTEGGDGGAMLAERLDRLARKLVLALRDIAEDDDDPLEDF